MLRFNPIAPTLLTKALQSLLSTHFSSPTTASLVGSKPTKEFLEIIVDSAHGDIRSAVMALQFACIVDVGASASKGSSSSKASKKKTSGNPKDAMKAVLASVTRREQSLELFHLIGKVMFNKRQFVCLYLCSTLFDNEQAKATHRASPH
jgi:cell cycle checkpoint protein